MPNIYPETRYAVFLFLFFKNGLLITKIRSQHAHARHTAIPLAYISDNWNGERNRFEANSNTANTIYSNSKYEQCQRGVLCKSGEIK